MAPQKNTRNYVTLRIAEDFTAEGSVFWEFLGVEEAANPDDARAAARGRFPEDQRSGVYVAIAEGQFKPKAGGRRQVWVDDESDYDLPGALPKVQAAPAKPQDSSGKDPLPGQVELDEALAAAPEVKDGEPIPEAEVAVTPDPVTIVPDAPAQEAPEVTAPPTDEEKARAKAARDERIKENARKYAEAQAAGEAAAAPDRAAAAEAVAKRMESEAKAVPATAPDGRTGAQVAEDLARTEAERKARVAAEKAAARDEPPAPVNADPDGWGDPSEAGGF